MLTAARPLPCARRILLGLAVGLVTCRLLRTPREFRVHTLVCVAFGNVGQVGEKKGQETLDG